MECFNRESEFIFKNSMYVLELSAIFETTNIMNDSQTLLVGL